MALGDGKFQVDDVFAVLERLLAFLKTIFPEEFIQEFLVKWVNSRLPVDKKS
jgi:hypothetical protein